MGHVQRGGSPTVRARVMAGRMGLKGVELLLEGKANRIVRLKDGQVSDIDINEGLDMEKKNPEELLSIVKKLTI